MTRDPEEIRIDASVPVEIIRQEYLKRGAKAALRAGKMCISGLTEEQILKIARSEATLRGRTPEPIRYTTNEVV